MKIILVAGARPNFMKIAPLMRAIQRYNVKHRTLSVEPLLVHTGQHYDHEMSQTFFEDLELPKPDIYLGVGSGTHGEQTAKVMIEFEKVLFCEKPDLVIVVGDVNSTVAAALATVKLHIPIAHVEAGIREDDLGKPEEVNRRVTDHISHYLFTPSRDADNRLRSEGIQMDRIFFVGNIMVDSLISLREKASHLRVWHQLGLTEKSYALLTLHKSGNVDNEHTLACLMEVVDQISKRIPVVFPAHPRTRKRLKELGLANTYANDKQLLLEKPVSYLDSLNLQMNAKFVMTDSGSLQAETTILNVPCLTLYPSSSWPITLTEGTNTLVGTNPDRIIEAASRLLEVRTADSQSTTGHRYPELWDGRAAERIVEVLTKCNNG